MPTLQITPWDPQTPNSEIIAKAWQYGSSDFQRRVPEPTKANLQASIRAITNYQPNYNEFAGTLINKVGRTIARNNSWQNVLAAYKLGMLEYGESIEEYQVGLIKAHTYDPRRAYGEKANFGRHGIDVQSNYHTINRENMYALTVDHPVLKRAFLSPTGLSDFAMKLMAAPGTSDNWDEFLIMSNLFREYENNGGFFKIHIDPVTNADSSKALLELLREYAEILPYLSERYNAAHMPVFADKDDLTLFVTPKIKAKLDVQGLAALFNVEYGDIPYKVQTIPEEFFFGHGADIQAILTTKDFFVCADTYFDTASQPNPAGRYENWFLHHDGIYSVSRFVPAIAFTLGQGTVEEMIEMAPVSSVDAITVTDSNGNVIDADKIVRGGSYIVSSGTNDNAPDAVRFTVDGFKSVYSFIENTGELHTAVNDSAATITITAIAVADNTITATRNLTVSGALVNYWPNPGVTPDADADGVLEVVPVEPSHVGDTVTIPSVKGVQYRKEGVNVNNGSTHEIGVETDFDAVARPGFEIPADAVKAWTFAPAP
jgi:hypothetical protein